MSKIIPLDKTLSGNKNGSITYNAKDDGADGYNPVAITTDIRPPLFVPENALVVTKNGLINVDIPEGFYGIGAFSFNVNVPSQLPLYTYPQPIVYSTNGDFFITVPTGYSGITSPSIQVRVPQSTPEGQKTIIYSIEDGKKSHVDLEKMSTAPAEQSISLSAYQVGIYIKHYPANEQVPSSFWRIVWHWDADTDAMVIPAGAHWTRFSKGSALDKPKSIVLFDTSGNLILSYGNNYDEGESETGSYLAFDGHNSIYDNSPIGFPWTE